MAKTIFTYTHADSRISTRSSNRVYTHVVVGCLNLVAERLKVEQDDSAATSWDYSARQAATEIGQPMHPGSPFPLDKRSSDEARAFVAQHPDRDAYIAMVKKQRLDYINERHGEGDKSPEYVLQWSMSEHNAEKGANQARKHWIDVAVRPVDPR